MWGCNQHMLDRKKWRFRKIGGFPQLSSIYSWIFHEINHPAMGGPPIPNSVGSFERPRWRWCASMVGHISTGHILYSKYIYIIQTTWVVFPNWLVRFGTCFIFHNILGIIIPTDELRFFRGVGIPPSSKCSYRISIHLRKQLWRHRFCWKMWPQHWIV